MATKAKKEKKTSNSKGGRTRSLTNFLKDERVPKVIGLTLIFISVILLVSFVSYLLNWKSDQDLVSSLTWSTVFNNEAQVSNTAGRLGAMVAHWFFYFLFGIGSFILLPVLFLSGIKIINKQSNIPLLKVYKYGFLSLIWITITLGLLFTDQGLGGGFGKHSADWLSGFMGTFGTGAFLLFALLIFLVINFNIDLIFKSPKFSFDPIKNFGNKFKYEEDTEVKEWEQEIVTENQQPEEEGKPTEVSFETSDTKTEEEPEPQPTDLDLEVSNSTSTANIEPAKSDDSGLELDIEESVEEEILDENIHDDKYDPTLDLSNYKYPTLDLLKIYDSDQVKVDTEELEKNKNQIVETLSNYNIEISKIKATIGPTVTLYEIIPAAGVRISKIKNLEDDIALSLAALGIRIIAPIPGKGTIGIEVPNVKKEIVSMHTLIASEKFQHAKMELPIAIGKTISNEIFVTDLAKMPHMLMAGATGQGKSVGLNAILVSLLYKKHPSQLKFVLIDPKKVELSLFTIIEKHFLAMLPGEEDAIITDTKKVINTLNALCIEMDNRYDLLKDAQVRNIKEYNAKFIARRLNPKNGHDYMPYIVLVIDEFADLMMTAGKEVETPIARLAQLARAIGIHLIIATQRPSVNIITGVIKANFPTRIAFKVTSKVDSRTILDAGGADQLIGRGDMLVAQGSDMVRLQCGFVDTPEVEAITNFIGEQQGYPEPFYLPEYVDENDIVVGGLTADERDDMFEEAARTVVQTQQGSTSMLQRRLKLGYNRAGRLMDQLEAAGIVGPSEGSKARQVLYPDMYQLEQFLNQKETLDS